MPADELNEALKAVDRVKPAKPSKPGDRKQVSGLSAGISGMLVPKDSEKAARSVLIQDDVGCETAYKFAFLGVGQGGSRIADSFWRIGYRRVGILNLTDKDFDGLSPDSPKLNFEVGGAAKDMEFARSQLLTRSEEVWDLLVRAWGPDPDYALVCVGLGGGTGSGTAAPLVQLARRYMEAKGRQPKVGVIASLPRAGEGQKICRNAVLAFKELLTLKVSPFILIDNGRIQAIYTPAMAKLYAKANEVVSVLLHVFNQLSAVRSQHITFDQSEFGQLLDGGISVMAAADIDKPHSPADISAAIRDKLANSVLAACDLRRGKKAGCLFVADEKTLEKLPADYFDAGFTQLDRIVGSTCADVSPVVHRGVYTGEDSDKPYIRCYVMVSELEPPHQRIAEMAKIGGLDVRGVQESLARHLGV